MNSLFSELKIPGHETKLIIYKNKQLCSQGEKESSKERNESEVTMQLKLSLFDQNDR